MSDTGRSHSPGPSWVRDADVERMATEMGYWKNWTVGTWSSDNDARLLVESEIRSMYQRRQSGRTAS